MPSLPMSTPLVVRVPFLQTKPEIDGLPKPQIEALPAVPLSPVETIAPEHQVTPRLRVAYGDEFLYILVTFAGNRIVARDRGYQFGDGLVVVVAEPMLDDAPSERYYMLGFSHQDRATSKWASRVLWEHDRVSCLLPLDRTVEVAAAATDGVGRLEVAIPWRVLHPYHPWLSPALGVNACFAKARGEGDTDFYELFPFTRGEQESRSSIRMVFEPPHFSDGHRIAISAPGRIVQGERLHASIAVCASATTDDRVTARIMSGEGDLVALDRLPFHVAEGLTRLEWEIDTPALPSGGFRIQWRSSNWAIESEQGLSVLPRTTPDELRHRARGVEATLPQDDAATLAFEEESLARRLAALPPARTAGNERLAMENLLHDISCAEGGGNPIRNRRGIFRRALRSQIDGSLQPFSVLIPQGLAEGPAPLCVTFHGSGVDDFQHLQSMGAMWFPPGFLVAAPYGRGASNSFTQGHAQRDVAEAVNSMARAYPVDPERVFLMGFSMGAYGALRTYFETPKRYRAVALFSTPPTARLDGEVHPDFTKPDAAKTFAGTPVFVFHGRRDNSTPLADAERMVEALQHAGASVTFIVEDGVGHGSPGSDTFRAYFKWIDAFVRT